MEATIKRTNDGVPQYAGEPELLPMYKEEALQYLMTLEVKKRYLAGPRLAKELTGVAKVAIRTQTNRDPQLLAHPRGTYMLLDFLESFLAKPTLVEASRYVMKFFYNLKRRRGETMTSWIARHSEALWEASQAMRKVQKEYEGKSGSQRATPTRSSGWGRQADRGSRAPSQTGGFDPPPGFEDPEAEEETEASNGTGEGHEDAPWSWEDWQSGGGWSGWSWNSWGAWASGFSDWKSQEYEPPLTWDTSSEIFIPEFLAGFLLLHRAGLDAQEKANILAAIRGEFSTSSVERALREQWADDDLARPGQD